MEDDKCSPLDRGQVIPGVGAVGEKKRRTRLEPGLPTDLVGWLHRTVRVHAHLLSIVRLYGNPSRAGGRSLEGDGYVARAARGDRTMLYDAITVARDELDAIRGELDVVMESAAPTDYPPGHPGKVDVMADRLRRGESLFVRDDIRSDGRPRRPIKRET